MKTCPKCGHTRQPTDMAPDYECPKCGIVYAKFGVTPKAPLPVSPAAASSTAAAKETKSNSLKALFAKIENREAALKIAKETGTLFMAVAALQALIGVFLMRALLLDAAIFATCGFFIFYKHSRVAAVIALALSAVAVVTTLMNLTGHNVGGGSNIFLAVIVAIAGVRGVEATFKLNGALKESKASVATASADAPAANAASAAPAEPMPVERSTPSEPRRC